MTCRGRVHDSVSHKIWEHGKIKYSSAVQRNVREDASLGIWREDIRWTSVKEGVLGSDRGMGDEGL